ncbi:Rho termination factor N-terminal domain-containing protein, partial [Microbispora sp. ATCC PTA-5024]|uniref:Rho termination factor N-terminal domain-containing protein n=1 Tax=Microbispora sp. ATCC PTA-5024 TaxID=316330 RepID=UPI0005632568
MSDTTELLSDGQAAGDTPTSAPARPRRRSGTGLAGMVLPELQAMATSLGITGTGRMRKSQLIAAIQEKQGGVAEAPAEPKTAAAAPAVAERPARGRRERSRATAAASAPAIEQTIAAEPAPIREERPSIEAAAPAAAAPAVTEAPVVTDQQGDAGQGDSRADGRP